MMCKCGVVLSISVVIVSSLILLVTSFNVDTFNYVQHKGPEQSMFGFSVATHKEHGRSWVLVGAPTSQGERSRIHRGGVVFKCSTTSDNGCDEVDFHQEKSGSSPPDDKNNQWFGATINSAGPDGPVVACAPRYVWFTTSREERRDPVGTCYIARDDFRKFSEYSPCRTSLYGYHRQGSCQAGFSAGISKDGKRLFVGAPGSWYWQGQTYSIDPTIKFPYTPGMFGEAFGFGTKGQVIQQSLDDRPAVMSTPEGPATDDDSYMGYSMIVGDFNGAGVQGIAVGMPKGGQEDQDQYLIGKVLLYTWNLTNYLNITGNQMGSYFGYALAASDIDGDNRDDLIIGAPMHAEPNNEMKYEVGRVHIAYQGRNGRYENRVFLDGFKSKSRFGLSLSTLGDMNLDGYGDFAVGAPYDGPNERGAVYIFQGSANGVIKKYSQVIYAEDIQGSFGGYYPLSTFGFSIAGGLDLDGNDYPDVAIGAYLSDTAYFFRARPVVRVEAIVKFDDPKVVRLDRKICDKPGDARTKVPCTWLQVCMRYTGVGAPPRIDLNLQYLLDVQKSSYSRMYSSRGNGKEVNGTITLFKDAPLNCDRSLRDTIYLKESIADKLTDLEVQVKYSLRDSGLNYQQYQRDPRAILQPIIDLSTPAIANDTISIFKNCGSDNVCIPDLHLYVRQELTKYLYDADKPIEFDIEITNSNDDSYNTKFFVELPQDIEFRGAPLIEKTQTDSKLACSPTFNASIFSCDVGNPLQKNTGVLFKLRVAPKRGQALLKPTYVFRMNVTSANPENNYTMADNTVTISIDIWVDAILAIEGKSTPTTVYYNVSQYNTVTASRWDTELGPPVIHSYTVTNKGPSDVNEVEIFIIWPGSTLAGEDLLYLLEPPHILGDVKCDRVDTNVGEKALSLQGVVWDAVGIHKGENGSHGGGNGTGVQTERPVPPIGSNTIRRTITTLTFYDVNRRPLHVMEVIGEQGTTEYWKNVSIAASQFTGPLIVEGNSSSLVIKFNEYGREISRTIVPRKPVPAELPYLSYQINSNVSTIVGYYALTGNLVMEEIIIEQPGSAGFKDRIQSTKDRLRQPVKVHTNTTWHFDYVTSDGRIHYHYILRQTGTDFGTAAEISSTVIHTYVTFYDSSGKILLQEIVEGDANTEAYWERVNKIISGFHEPVTLRTNTTKVITYVLHGKEIRKEEIPVPTAPQQASLTTNTRTVTTVKVTSFNGRVLFEENIPGEKGSVDYNEYFNGILGRIKEPALIETKTVYTITYSSSDGRQAYRGIYTEIRTETYNPNKIESSRTSTITTIIFYDAYNNIVHQENITEPVGTSAYWERVNELISKYHGQPITMKVDTRTIITHYINSQEVSSEQVPGSGAQAITYKPQIVVTTTIRVFNANGQVLEEITVPGRRDSASDIVSRYHEPITVESKIVTVITYHSADGLVTHRGTYTETRTETHMFRQPETSQTRTITTIIVYDLNRNIIHQENVTDEVGSESYWERINGILSRSQQHQASVRVTTRTIIVYYVDGQEVRSEQVGGPSGVQDISYRTQTVISTRVIVYGSNRRVLYDETTPGKKGSINDIISRFNELITVEIQTVYTISYYGSDGRVAYTGTITETRTETHRPSEPQTSRKSVITTIIFYDVNRNIIYQEDITEEPQSAAYWEKVNQLITRFQQQYQQITIHVTTRTIITYYVDGHATHTEEVTETPGSHDTSITPRVVVTTVITVYNANRKVLFEGTVSGEKGSTEYDNYVSNIISKFREPITIVTKTTYVITYYGSSGRVLYTGTEIKENTETHNRQPQISDSRSSTITIIKFYGANGNLLHQETISDEPKSTRYWEHIKQAISSFDIPINIYTNSSRIITYYVDGVESRTEYLPGIVMEPFTSHFEDAVTVISYEDANKNVIHRETIQGELTMEEKRRRATEFSKRHSGSFTMEIDTTKTITFRTADGQVLYTETIAGPALPGGGAGAGAGAGASTSVTETSFTVYGPDRRTVLHQETINGEPGSAAYNQAVANIISKYTGSITIYTNSTKTITYYGTDGRTLNRKTVPEPRSTVQRESEGSYGSSATTSITFYGPDGRAIHHDTIDGAPGQDLYRQLDAIAREYGGVVKSYGGNFNEDGSIGGAVTVVDTPYPGGKPQAPDHHFTDFEEPHGQTHTWNTGFNHSEGRGYGHASDSSDHRINYQDLNANQDLGAFGKGKGFRTGAIGLGIGSGNVDQSVDGQARSHFETRSGSQSYDGSHNYLSGVQTYQHEGSTSRYGKRKREVDTTDSDITQLSKCTTSSCFTIRCTSGPLRKGQEVHIAMRARVVVQTLKNISMTQPVNIQSMLLARISRFQEISGSPAQRTLYRQQAITSVIAPSPDIKPDIVPLWVVILSAVAGTLILLLLIFLLHKCGFFKRNRPSNAPERQPLNRNGHFQHGDEAL